MALLLHITIALASLGYTAYVFFYPSKSKLRVSYALIGLTLATGTYLVVSMHTNILRTCATGLAYTAAVSVATFVIRNKLAAQEADK